MRGCVRRRNTGTILGFPRGPTEHKEILDGVGGSRVPPDVSCFVGTDSPTLSSTDFNGRPYRCSCLLCANLQILVTEVSSRYI